MIRYENSLYIYLSLRSHHHWGVTLDSKRSASSLKDKIEIATNILIVLIMLLLGGSYLKTRLGHSSDVGLTIGNKLEPPKGYNWREHGQTLVVAVRKGCTYCERSYPFYRRLESLEHGNHLKAHMLMVMPDDPSSGAALLAEQGITSQSIGNIPLSSIKVSGTPTLLLVDANGRLLQRWVGELDASNTEAVLAKLLR
jgi:thioredoxin-related protein